MFENKGSVDLEKRESSGDSSLATSKERLSNSDGGKGERLAKLSSIDRQKDTHSRQLKKVETRKRTNQKAVLFICFFLTKIVVFPDFVVRYRENEYVQKRGKTQRNVQVFAAVAKGEKTVF